MSTITPEIKADLAKAESYSDIRETLNRLNIEDLKRLLKAGILMQSIGCTTYRTDAILNVARSVYEIHTFHAFDDSEL